MLRSLVAGVNLARDQFVLRTCLASHPTFMKESAKQAAAAVAGRQILPLPSLPMMSSVQTCPNHQITIFCLGILEVYGFLGGDLAHCPTKVKEALTVAVLIDFRSAFNIFQICSIAFKLAFLYHVLP